MFGPLTYVLAKIFARGFYKVHSGLLLFFFVTFIISFFYIGVLNQTHLPSDQIILHNLALVLATITSPVMASLVLLFWLMFTIKSWNYVSAQLSLPDKHFLFYSTTAANKATQFKAWFIVQLVISIPMLIYAVFAIGVGIIFGHYFLPAILLLCVLCLAGISAWIYVWLVNKTIRDSASLLSLLVRRYRKPLFSLFLYHVFHNLRWTLIMTKLFSLGIITGGYYLLGAEPGPQGAALIALGIVYSHIILIYHSHTFETTQLSALRNLPYSRGWLYGNLALTYLLLTLPENLWLLASAGAGTAILLIAFNLGTGMLFRSMLYYTGAGMRKFLYQMFFAFIVLFLAMLMKLLWLVVLITTTLSVIIFYLWYYRQQSLIKT